VTATVPQPVSEIPKVSHKTWMLIGREQDAALLAVLRGLSESEWLAPTECEPWDVKDVAAHTLAWAEALSSPRLYGKQAVEGIRNKRSFGGSSLDATNDYQVRSLRELSTDEILTRLDKHLRRMNSILGVVGVALRPVPYREPFSGHWVNLGYVANRILTRDHFMHRLDIYRALGSDVASIPSDSTIVADVVKEWARRSDASVTLDLRGPAGGSFVCGTGSSGSVRCDAYDLMRRLAGREGNLEVDGDRTAIGAWLRVLCTF
jgi:uncharacterized protein (TIGR03083 family)